VGHAQTWRPWRHAAAFVVVAALLSLSASGAFAFSASFNWCGGGSPSFELKDVPQGTTALQFAMTDRNVPRFHHGGGKVAYSGQATVPCDTFSSGFIGPSPPPGQVHTYEFTIRALGQGGAALATTTARRKFPE
jgi:phosphatidylethanolamine-binding protein (PEBP) family uncharacterized protein